MSYSIQSVLGLDIFDSCQVLTAQDQLPKRIVQGVSVMEEPVENFVQPGELVLTTGIGCSEKPDHFLRFVREVKEAQAAGLMVAIGKHIHDIPEQVAAFGQRQKFPIITLPWELRFAEIVRLVLQKIHAWQPTHRKWTIAHQSNHALTEKMLQTVASDRTIDPLLQQVLDPLIAYRKQRQIDLISTLRAYIRHRGNVSQTARSLHLHRQSLLYRLHKIETLTNRSLVDADDLFLFDLSTRLYDAGVDVKM